MATAPKQQHGTSFRVTLVVPGSAVESVAKLTKEAAASVAVEKVEKMPAGTQGPETEQNVWPLEPTKEEREATSWTVRLAHDKEIKRLQGELAAAVARVSGQWLCPRCEEPAVEFADGEYRCKATTKVGKGKEARVTRACFWRDKRTPEAHVAYKEGEVEGRAEARRQYDEELDILEKRKQYELLTDAIKQLGRETHPRESQGEADPEKVAHAEALAVSIADNLATTLFKLEQGHHHGREYEKRLERLRRPAEQYLALRGLDGKKKTSSAQVETLNETDDTKRRKPTYTITLTVEGSRLETVRKKADEAFGKDLKKVAKIEHATSRSGQLAEAMEKVEDAKSEVESLKEQLEDWKGNLPESFQNGSKGEQLDEAVQQLEQVVDSLDTAISEAESVEFPGMF